MSKGKPSGLEGSAGWPFHLGCVTAVSARNRGTKQAPGRELPSAQLVNGLRINFLFTQ